MSEVILLPMHAVSRWIAKACSSLLREHTAVAGSPASPAQTDMLYCWPLLVAVIPAARNVVTQVG